MAIIPTLKIVNENDTEIITALAKALFAEAFAGKMAQAHLENYLNEAFTVEAIRAEISEHNNVFVLALVNNEPIGYLKLVSNESRGYIEVDKLYLFKKYQGRGVGRQLMTFAEETAKKKKMWTITLVVWEKNISALEFYQYHGYTIEGKTERNKGGEIQIGLRLRKTLKKVSD